MHVEDVQEDADARRAALRRTATTLPSAGETATGPDGIVALGVAEEVQAERGQKEQRHAEDRAVSQETSAPPAASASA